MSKEHWKDPKHLAPIIGAIISSVVGPLLLIQYGNFFGGEGDDSNATNAVDLGANGGSDDGNTGSKTSKDLDNSYPTPPESDNTNPRSLTPTISDSSEDNGFRSVLDTYIDPNSYGGMGVYEQKANAFKQGETLTLYVEAVGFANEPIKGADDNIAYSPRLTWDYILQDPRGNVLNVIDDIPISRSLTPTESAKTPLQLSVSPEALPASPEGEYRISYIVKDRISAESFRIDKDITIEA